MRTIFYCLAAAVAMLATGGVLLAQKQAQPLRPAAPKAVPKAPTNVESNLTKAPAKPTAPSAANPSHEADDKAIRQLAEEYAKAYNAHDAKALANLFTTEAQIVDEAGDAIQGRDAIEDVYTALFEEYPDAATKIEIKGIRFLGPTLAAEKGVAQVTFEPGEPAEPNHYLVVHVKQDGRWMMASAHDVSPGVDDTPEEHLEQLAWLVGDWVDESPEAVIETTYRWDEGHKFLLSEFNAKVAGRDVMHGTQRIGWDPQARVIRSWVFDSDGGFTEGVYSRDGNQWIIKLAGVTSDGKASSATNVLTRLNKDRASWESRDRTVGGEPTPDTGLLMMVRKPPQPQ